MTLLERDAPLNQLEDLLRGVAGGTGHVVLLGGEAGIGKTSLVAALAERHSEIGLWWGACDALQTPHPLSPLQDIARTANVGFRTLLGADADRAALFESVLSELRDAIRPTLLVIEDAHWADAATLDLLKFIGRRIDRLPCLLLVSYRDEEVDSTHALRGLMGSLPTRLVTRLQLPRLSAEAVKRLARSALRSPENIHAITQGNPFFVVELLRHGSKGVPHGVQDLVLARYARLGVAAQEIVRLVSLVPTRIERWLVDSLLDPAIEALEECFNSGLLLATDSSLAFRHELARVAIESSLSATLAQSLHAQILASLEREGGKSVSLARLVHHAAHAADSAAVLRLAPEAARQAQLRRAHKESAAHLRTALAHGQLLSDADRAQLLDWQSYECYLTDRITEAIEARLSSKAFWHSTGDGIREGDALRWLSRLYWYNGQTGVAEEYATLAIQVLEPLAPGRELAMAYSNRSQLSMVALRSAESIEWGNKALDLASAIDDLEVQVHALNNIGTSKLDLGDETGRQDLERSLGLALDRGFEEHVARAYTNLSYESIMSRNFDRALDELGRGIAYCAERDLDSWTNYMGAYRAEAWLSKGDWDCAVDLAEAVLASTHVAPISKITALVVLGRIRARRGAADPLPLLDEALQLALPTGNVIRIGAVAAARAEAAWLAGDVERTVREAKSVPGWETPGHYARWVSGEIAVWLHRAGEPDARPTDCPTPFVLEMERHWREAAAAWQALGCPCESARAMADGDADAQREALAMFEKMGARPDAERVRRRLNVAGVRGVPRGSRASTKANPHGLTGRELQVLRLLCEGLANAQIADRLRRSVRTVDHHLAAVFAKLGVTTRAQAVAAAMALGIGAEK